MQRSVLTPQHLNTTLGEKGTEKNHHPQRPDPANWLINNSRLLRPGPTSTALAKSMGLSSGRPGFQYDVHVSKQTV
jgi:hypothetical protein